MPIKLIQVGLGRWGRNWAARVLPEVKSVKTVGYVDGDTSQLELAREQTGIQAEDCFDSLETALAQRDCDAVLVTTAIDGHVPVALAALRAGKHVLLEKPFAPDSASARRVVTAALRRRCILMISQNYRFQPAPVAVRRLVSRNELGPVGAVYVDFRRRGDKRPATDPHFQLWHPLLVDMAIHHWDLMRMVLGQEPVRIACHTWNPPWSYYRMAPAALATLEFSGGTVVHYRGNLASTDEPTNWGAVWRMECEKGVIHWTTRGDHGDQVRIVRPGCKERILPLSKSIKLDREGSLAAFARAIRSGTTPDTAGEDNLRTLECMLALVDAAESGVPVTLRAANRRP